MIDEQALNWVIRTRDADFADWDGFMAWLENAPAHAVAYDVVALLDADMPAILPLARAVPPVPANDCEVAERRNRWRAWAGISAVVALLAIVSVSMIQRADPYSVTTSPGERRRITLDDGTRIALNGGSVLRLDHADPRFAALDRGEAMFTVRHDAKTPFRVVIGDAVLQDAGTVFNVRRDAGMMRVGVAEGAVIYNPDGEGISLLAGRTLQARDRGTTPIVGTMAPEAVGSWHSGRLIYTGATMDEVAGDIARNLGVTVRAGKGANAMRFTGTIVLDRDPARFFVNAAPLLGVRAAREGKGWLLEEADATRD